LALILPKTGPERYRQILPRVGHDLETVFLDTGKTSTTTPSNGNSGVDVKPATSEWVDVVSAAGSKPKILSLPSIETLSRPEILFSSLLPYYVIVNHSGGGIQIEGSHQPTIDLVHAYFQKHTRKNMNLTTQVLPLYHGALHPGLLQRHC
jgi:hypothetical protein